MTTNTTTIQHLNSTADRSTLLDRFARAQVHATLTQFPELRIAERLDSKPDAPSAAPGDASVVEIRVHDAAVYRRVLLGGALGAAEAYIDGQWTTNDLVALCRLFARDDADLALESRAARLAMPVLHLLNVARRNSRRGSRRNIAAHYDLGNDFFAEWLDETMTYSSAIFDHPAQALAHASTNKLDRICRMLRLRPTDRLLEIGSGWGSFALHAAQRYGCAVTTTTISREQFDVARERVRAAGLESRVTVLLEDYRDLRGAYSKLASIEMIEAVGQEFLEAYFAKCASLLEPDGLFALQAILIRDQRYDLARRSVDFIKRYIFPGGSLPSASAALRAATAASDFGLVRVDDITPHYALTLRRWRERFLDRAAAVRALGYDDRFVRMWEYYLAYCEAGFAERLTTCAQILLARSGFRTTVGDLA